MDRSYLGGEMERLKAHTLALMYMAQTALRKALLAIGERNRELALEVMEGDAEIDRLECAADVEGLRLLALQQPVARDLRFIVGCMRLAGNVERVGDEAVNIADRCVILLERPPLAPPKSLDTLADMATELLGKAVTAFVDGSAPLARDVLEAIPGVTALHYLLFKEMTEIMVRESRTVERAVQMSFIAHSLRRVCDQAANIAETVIFIVEGVNVKHSC